jgi:polar amino acid transport system substrate-binding protein
VPPVGLVAGFIGVGLAATGAPTARAESTLERIKDQGYIRMGFANENPFSYATPEGELAGVDVDILNHILADMGVKEIDGGLTTFGGLIPGLVAKRFDLVSSAIYIKPDRCAQVAFAEPLYIQGDAIVVAAGNPKKIHSYSDVAAYPTIKIGYPKAPLLDVAQDCSCHVWKARKSSLQFRDFPSLMLPFSLL